MHTQDSDQPGIRRDRDLKLAREGLHGLGEYLLQPRTGQRAHADDRRSARVSLSAPERRRPIGPTIPRHCGLAAVPAATSRGWPCRPEMSAESCRRCASTRTRAYAAWHTGGQDLPGRRAGRPGQEPSRTAIHPPPIISRRSRISRPSQSRSPAGKQDRTINRRSMSATSL